MLWCYGQSRPAKFRPFMSRQQRENHRGTLRVSWTDGSADILTLQEPIQVGRLVGRSVGSTKKIAKTPGSTYPATSTNWCVRLARRKEVSMDRRRRCILSSFRNTKSITMKITAACTLALVASASAFAPASTASVSLDMLGVKNKSWNRHYNKRNGICAQSVERHLSREAHPPCQSSHAIIHYELHNTNSNI